MDDMRESVKGIFDLLFVRTPPVPVMCKANGFHGRK